jgi:hypothetical protein
MRAITCEPSSENEFSSASLAAVKRTGALREHRYRLGLVATGCIENLVVEWRHEPIQRWLFVVDETGIADGVTI